MGFPGNKHRVASATALAALGGLLAVFAGRSPEPAPPPPEPQAPDVPPAPAPPPQLPPEEVLDTAERLLTPPTGDAPELDCNQARKIVAQARTNLAVAAEQVDREKLAKAVSDWLDPHGLWSVAPDAPILRALTETDIAADLEASPGSGPCVAADAVGIALAEWVGDLRTNLQSARATARRAQQPKLRFDLASATPFEDGTVTRKAHDLARLLGQRLGTLEASFGPDLEPFSVAASDRLVPAIEPRRWSGVVLAAAVRAYVPQIDPHGAWAPLDEEASIYDIDLEVDPPPRLWGEMTRTVVGIRIDEGAKAPLRDGDVVLRIGSLPIGGMSVEQANQLSFVPHGHTTRVTVLRADQARPLELEIDAHVDLLSTPPSGVAATGLFTSRVGYGEGETLVVKVPDVPDDLGERLMATLAPDEDDKPVGILLDLRGNGGGSTEGALSAIGVFLPGAPLFPMRRRDGEISVDRAPRLPADSVWTGPVAALVDGDSASAAEMIAGALAAYRRGPILGGRTYGKGCAQEYLDDESGVGVLRLTTLVFCLPDGSPVQRVGVMPHVALGLPAGVDREESLPRAPNTWRGPDVRVQDLVQEVPWPEHGGRLGNAGDPVIGRALRALGTSRVSARGVPGSRSSGR